MLPMPSAARARTVAASSSASSVSSHGTSVDESQSDAAAAVEAVAKTNESAVKGAAARRRTLAIMPSPSRRWCAINIGTFTAIPAGESISKSRPEKLTLHLARALHTCFGKVVVDGRLSLKEVANVTACSETRIT